MRVNSHCAMLFGLALPCLQALATPASPTAQTVGQMLKLDAALAMERVRDRMPVPATAPARSLPGAAAAAPAPPQMEVLAILGLNGAQRVDLILNGRLYRMLTVGRVADKWQLAEVQGRCIRLTALDPARTPDVQQCFADTPPRAPQAQPSALARSLAAAEALPLPMPTAQPLNAGTPSRPATPVP